MNPLIDAVEAPLLSFAQGLINRVWPDPQQQAAAQLSLLQLQQSGELAQLQASSQITLAQIGVDDDEAKSENIFKSGWRPFIGWVCGSSFAWNFVMGPSLNWSIGAIGLVIGHPVAVSFTTADMTQMTPVLMGLLGLGAMRTVEKLKGQQ